MKKDYCCKQSPPAGCPQQGRFGSLQQCEAAYTKLEGDCAPQEIGAQGCPQYKDHGGLREDSQGNHMPGRYSMPPTAAFPGGWDYRHHGDDWVTLGECGGPNQSPIDLPRFVGGRGQTKYLLWFDYYLDPALTADTQEPLVNDGHDLRVSVRSEGVDLGFVKIGDRSYGVSDCVFHAPSEHSIDGAVFPLELQIYNKAKDGDGIVAVSIFFREGESNPFLAAIMNSTGGHPPKWDEKAGPGSSMLSGRFPDAFDLHNVLPLTGASKEKTFYNYQGSLTQPPCTTGVDWWVLSVPVSATRDEIRFVRRGIFETRSTRHGNARGAAPLGARTIVVGLTGMQGPEKTWHRDEWP
jgi:carbonic anhydrase